VMDKTLSAIRMTRAEPVPQWLLVNSLADRAAAIPGNWRRRAETIAAERIVPALDRQIAELAEHRKVSTTDIGVWKFGDGADYYAWALRAATTTRMTPDEVHDNGLAQLADLHGQMDVILKSLGSTDGSVGARMLALAKDPRYAFSDGDKGRAEIMAFIQQRLADIRPRLPRAFHTLVRGNVEVRRIAPAEEAGAPGAYGGAGSIDGSVPGRFWINLRSTAMHQRYSLPTLTYHEAIPGHVWQGEYSFRLPLIRTLMGFSAFSEGWALYAEQLISIRWPSAPRAWSSTPASTTSAGTATRRSRGSPKRPARPSTASPAKSIAIASGRVRPAPTRSATATSTASASARRRRWATASTIAASTTSSSQAAAARSPSSNRASIAGWRG
jgi:uncharacterized protein (DUF885 family)